MNYKDIFEELDLVLWGEEYGMVKNKNKNGDEINPHYGLLLNIYDPFHNGPTKMNSDEWNRVSRICKKFADKLYLDTKDEYAVKVLSQICEVVGEIYIHCDIEDIGGTKEDPAFMFSEYDPSLAKEPELEQRYRVVKIRTFEDGEKEETITNYRFKEEALSSILEEKSRIQEFVITMYKDEEKRKKIYDEIVIEDSENVFKTKDLEMRLEKRSDKNEKI